VRNKQIRRKQMLAGERSVHGIECLKIYTYLNYNVLIMYWHYKVATKLREIRRVFYPVLKIYLTFNCVFSLNKD